MMNDTHMPDAERRALDEKLVSYLDGELDAAESSQVEHALAQDARVRRELKQLERCWELLDELPREEVGEDFTRTTVEMIAVQAERELAEVEAELPSRKRKAWLLAAGAFLTAGIAGFIAVGVYSDRENKKLLKDLPVVENLDQYRQVEDINFLRALRDKNLLPHEPDNASTP
jgi:anti-sigma factor RsiW